MSNSICTIDGCVKTHYGRGLCNMHWQRVRSHGHTGPGKAIRGSFDERFEQSFVRGKPHLCWEWRAKLVPDGYGMLNRDGVGIMAHRVSYEKHRGPIPRGLVIDHLCRNRRCVNPNHLEAVTPRVNVLRGVGLPGVYARATHCIHGHPFAGENLRIDKSGERVCRTCAKRRRTEFDARRRQRAVQ